MKGLILLLVPMAALTIAQSVPLVHLVFSHTRLNEADLRATASLLVWFSLGMFAWGAQNILARGFYATHDTITPAVVGTILTGLNILLSWFLVRRDAYVGLAMASSIGITVYMLVLFVLLARRTHDSQAWGLVWFLTKVGTASVIAGFACRSIVNALGERISWRTTHGAFLDLCITTAAGLGLTLLLTKLFRIDEVNAYMKRIASSLGRAFS
jgi:putative peptidoglycan lipid II flippase